MKKISLLAAAVSMALTGCGSDDSNPSPTPSTPPSTPSSLTVTAIDGYLSNADIYVGENCLDKIGTTDTNGQRNIDGEYQDQKICIRAIEGQTIDQTRGPVEHNFQMAAPAGYDVISPMTNLVVDQMDAGTTQEEAEALVVKSVSSGMEEGNTVSEEVLFGDYVAEDSTEADVIELISETLVDLEDKELTAEQKLETTEQLSEDIAEEVTENDGELPADYAPVVSVIDGTIVTKKNYKPTITSDYTAPVHQDVEIIDAPYADIQPINIATWFDDADEDSLNYTVDSYLGNEITTNFSVNSSNEIVGQVDKAGTYVLYVFADDNKVRSEPAIVTITVMTTNTAPTIDTDTATLVQGSLSNLIIRANENVNEQVSITGLFSDETDELTYSVIHNTNAEMVIQGELSLEVLNISGAFNSSDVGEQTISISADDGINEPVAEEFILNIQEAIVVNTAPVVVDSEKDAIQVEINTLDLTEGNTINNIIDISELFFDAEDDQLTYEATSTLSKNGDQDTGFQVMVDPNGSMSFEGLIPFAATAGESIYVKASDGLMVSEWVVFTLPEIKEDTSTTPVQPDDHPLENKIWHYVEIGSNGTNYSKAWCDSLYLDSNTKTIVWNSRNNNNLSTCDTDLSTFNQDEAIQYTITDGYVAFEIEGEKLTLALVQEVYDTRFEGNNSIVSLTEGSDESIYAYYTKPSHVEEVLYNPVALEGNGEGWVNTNTYTVTAPSDDSDAEGSTNIVVEELKLSALIQDFMFYNEVTDSHERHTEAELSGRNSKTCEILKDQYGTIYVHDASGNDVFPADSYFSHNDDGTCQIEIRSWGSDELPSGVYTIDAKPENTSEAQRILFSFVK